MSEHTATMIASEIDFDIPFGVPGFRYAEGKPLFCAFGCVLMEKETASAYIYRAYNLETNKSALISRRKNQMGDADYEKAAAKMGTLPIAGRGFYEADRSPGEKLEEQRMARILRVLFRRVLPAYGYRLREPQMELAEHILDCLSRRGVTLAEAEVGIGKTLAYLAAAVLVKRGRVNDFWLRGSYPGQSWADSAHMPVVISTSSIALQRAIVRDYIPELSRILMESHIIRTPLSCVLRKGREHYLCERRLRSYLADADEAVTAALAPLLGSGASIDLADAPRLTPYIKRRIGVSGRCDRHCPHREDCRYLRHMESARSNRHDFQVCNHQYLLADVLRRRDSVSPLIPDYQAVIIDEGHKLLEAARQLYGMELSPEDIPPVAADIHSFDFRQGESGSKIWRDAKKLAGQSKRLFGELAAAIPEEEMSGDAERFTAVLGEESTRHLRNIRQISERLRDGLSEAHVQTRHRDRCAHVLWELENIQKRAAILERHGDLVCWTEKSGEGLVLRAIPKNLDELLHRDFWSMGVPIVLTSGTLSAAKDFTRVKGTLGLGRLPSSRLTETCKPSPFDHYRNTLLYISERVPFPDNQSRDYLAAVADEVERLVRASHGHAAVLFTSYKAMDIVREMLERRGLPYPFFQLHKGKVDAIQQFKRSGNGVLFASGALWEGIDIPGDALSMLIIVKLPFPVPDPIGEYERSLCPDMEAYKAGVIVPDMLVKLRQGFGRLIRTETDSGVVALLDFRAGERGSYRDRVLRALPRCPVTGSIVDVSAFLRKKKTIEYFI